MIVNPPNRRRGDGEQPPPDPPSVRVLLVDDDDNFRAWMSLLMRRLGFLVETAADGVLALEHLRCGAFDLLISDLEMPRMNGMELIREIRATPELAHQYAVMLTSHEDLDSKVGALTTGYDDFLTKSCTEVEVVAKVIAAHRMLSRQRIVSTAAHEWQTIATRDELTGVSTRRAFVEEAERCLTEGRFIGIALLDLDDFKPINDNFGHLTGDRILRDIGALFLSRTRSTDLIARWGGDEFVLLVRDLALDDVAGAAERLVTEVASMQWTSGDLFFGMSVTSGVAHSSLLDSPTLEQLLDVADRDLYAKKWLKKHPGERSDLYEYPDSGASIVSLPPSGEARKRVAEEEN
ncbi:MAG TPA: diguanylate cyclase [Thermoanaerobaculia bacterium]|nr:diguanylate cyclase [Thermoanaerobaculia bacterium]